jgi:hypothetical protein
VYTKIYPYPGRIRFLHFKYYDRVRGCVMNKKIIHKTAFRSQHESVTIQLISVNKYESK